MLSNCAIALLRPFWFRGKLRLLEPLIPASRRVEASVFGYRMQLDLQDLIQRQIYLGCYEPHETVIFRRIARPGSVVIDVGANVGYFTALAARLVGGTGRVFSIEPSPLVFQTLEQMLRANPMPHVVAFPIGLSDAAGEVSLYLPPADSGNHTPSMVAHDATLKTLVVPVRKLDDCLRDWNVSRVDLLKLDVEGFEPKVLGGAFAALSSGAIKNVLMEFNEDWLTLAGSSCSSLYGWLQQLGFEEAKETANIPVTRRVSTRWMRWVG